MYAVAWLVRTNVLMNLRNRDPKAIWVHVHAAAVPLDRAVAGKRTKSVLLLGNDGVAASFKALNIACFLRWHFITRLAI